jgi:hypothetical protein
MNCSPSPASPSARSTDPSLPLDKPAPAGAWKPGLRLGRALPWLCIAWFSGSPGLHAQSPIQGNVLLKEDFSSQKPDPAQFQNDSWNVPDTWELRDGALASLYDPKQHPGKAHGKSINPKFKGHDLRISYRVRLDSPDARLAMIPNAVFPPVKTGIPVWHIGDVNLRLPKNDSDKCVSIAERDFTYDENDPRNTRKSHGPADIFKPLGAYSVSGIHSNTHAPLQSGQWHQIVVETVGTQWTLWIDGKQTLAMTLQHSDCTKETINFIASGALLLDDLLIEELPRSNPSPTPKTNP